MIHSMTAFARDQLQGKGLLTCEMRSINHRYLEISVYLPDMLHSFEMPVRECIRQFLKRGKIECSLRYQPGADTNTLFTVNMPLARELCQAAETISGLLKQASPIQSTEILRFPGVLESHGADEAALGKDVLKLVEKTAKDLVAAREREGNGLKQLFLERMDLIQKEVSKVREHFPQVLKDSQEKLIRRFTEVKVELDPARLEQEMVMFAQKIDVVEEVERIETHITEVRRVLKQGGLVGRRLDFLLQELNREANTLGSKSVDSVLTHAAVEMKVLIEQVREQVQNVE